MHDRLLKKVARRYALGVVALVVCCGLMVGCSAGSSGTPRDFNALMNGMLHRLTGNPDSNSKTPLKEAARMFDNASPDQQREAIAWLARQPYGHKTAYLQAYQIAAQAPSSLVRGQAMMATGTSHDPKLAPTIAKGLADRSSFVRMSAAIAAAEIVNPILIGPLIKDLRADSDNQVRVDAALALQHYNTRRVHRALIYVLDDPNVAVAQAAWSVLHKQTGQNLPMHAGPWLKWLHHSH
jgi:HEAT repeat protein